MDPPRATGTLPEMHQITLRGTFVTLRPLNVRDTEVTLKWRNDSRARYLQRGATTMEQQRHWIESRTLTPELNFIIEYAGRSVGMFALLEIDSTNRRASIGRLLIGEKDFVGAAPVFYESELLLCDYAFDVLGMHKIHGLVMQNHLGMINTRVYLGYRQEGILRDHYLKDGLYTDAVEFSILEAEYREECRPRLIRFIELYRSVAGAPALRA